MNTFIIFFTFLFPLLHTSTTAQPCPITRCAQNQVPIRFPFYQQATKHPQNCGYPGFNLSCKTQSTTYLSLPYSGDFYIRDINYLDQLITLYDPNNCLPNRLLTFNISGTPFVIPFHENYTFLTCPSEVIKSRFDIIECMSNSTHSVLATSSMRLVSSLVSSYSCRVVVAALPVPVSWPVKEDEEFTAELGGDIQLTWYVPQCGDCEAQGEICGFKSNNSDEIDCFRRLPESSQTGNGLRVFGIICLSIAVPALACATGIALFACCFSSRNHAGESPVQWNNRPAAVLPQPAAVVTGLDESTIESYEKLVLGESRRIPGPNDSTCPICLSEYLSKDTIRCIPECKHCFHAECIDEWLRMNSTCPVCRKSPTPEDTTPHTNPV
ncbi:hypothetical protein Gotri_026616 [Gossypium trilobum]|uniref:RING-type E3 ubiquitin transferase n=1 Tax=Gossypium trilobum TaxID=34281 RepID=A0A7J9FPG4_9ROSI|nr:hypothetical protein [Gossypium trilobum]